MAVRPLQIMEGSSELPVPSITRETMDSKRESKYTTNKKRRNDKHRGGKKSGEEWVESIKGKNTYLE